jgi:hypothetical protein
MVEDYIFNTRDDEGKLLELHFIPETHRIREDIDLAYAKAFKFYFTNGVMTRAQALDIARENGILDARWEERMTKAMVDLAEASNALDNERSKKRKSRKRLTDLKAKVLVLRTEYNRLVDCQSDIVQATCEARAENRQIEIGIVLRCVDGDGNQVFKDHEDLVQQYGSQLVSDVVQHMVCLRAGVPYEMVEEFPEETEK